LGETQVVEFGVEREVARVSSRTTSSRPQGSLFGRSCDGSPTKVYGPFDRAGPLESAILKTAGQFITTRSSTRQ
jgi:hypothetical protein